MLNRFFDWLYKLVVKADSAYESELKALEEETERLQKQNEKIREIFYRYGIQGPSRPGDDD